MSKAYPVEFPGSCGSADLADPACAFRHDLWFELTVAVAGYGEPDRPVNRRHGFRRSSVTGIACTGAGRVTTIVVEQSVNTVDRSTGRLRIGQEGINRRRIEKPR
jgi:hypothetical protein